MPAQKYQELWVFAYQPKTSGHSSNARPTISGYFTLYAVNGAYKVGVGGPMMPISVEKDIVVDSSSSFNLDATTSVMTIKLEPPTSYISGYIKDGTGSGISSVDIYSWCEGGPGGGHALTDSQGFYKMYTPICSNYHVGGFAPNYGELTERSGISVTASVNPTVNFTLSSGDFITVSGHISSNGSSQSNVDVWITQSQFGSGLGAARSDTTGDFQIRLQKGLSNLYLHAAVPGKGEFYNQQLNSGNALNASTTENITVNKAVVEIHLEPGNTFNNVFIGAHSNIGRGFTNTRVSTSSSYDVYKVEVPYSGGGTVYTFDGGIPGFGPIPASSVTISTSTTLVINLSTISFWTISGTVSANVGTSTDAFVWAGGPQGGGETRVQSDGTFSLKLREGVYDIGVGKVGYTGSATSADVDSNITNLHLTLTHNTETISGYVKYNGDPISGIRIWADNGNGGWAGGSSDADGSFSLNVGSGSWKIGAIGDGYRLEPMVVAAPASGLILNLTRVSFNPIRKEQSMRPTQGGIIQTTDTMVEIPAGALGSGITETSVRIKNTMSVPAAQGAKIITSGAKNITAAYASGDNNGQFITNLSKDITLEIVLTKSELIAGGISTLDGARKVKIGYYDSLANNWVSIPTVTILSPTGATWNSLSSITLKGTTSHLSSFAPMYSTEGAPSTPVGLQTTIGDRQVSLSWTAVSGASKYNIYRKSGNDYPYLGQTANTSYTDTGLANGTTYYYKVSALSSSDQESAATAEISATPQTQGGAVIYSGGGESLDTIPPSISNIQLQIGSTKAVISWQTSEPSLSWLLYGTSTSYGFTKKLSSYLTSHSSMLTGLLPQTTYHYQVKSEDKAGNIAAYTDKVFTTLAVGSTSLPIQKETTVLPRVTFEKPISKMSVSEIKIKIQEIMKVISQLNDILKQVQTAGTSLGKVPAGFKFQKFLKLGARGKEVKYLQIILNSDPKTALATSGPGAPGQETDYFGLLTKQAITKFQEKYAKDVLNPWGLSQGTGFVGKTTQAKLNEILKSNG